MNCETTPDRRDALFVDRLTVRGTRRHTGPETDKYHLSKQSSSAWLYSTLWSRNTHII